MNWALSLATAALVTMACSFTLSPSRGQSVPAQYKNYDDTEAYKVLSLLLERGHGQNSQPLRIYTYTAGDSAEFSSGNKGCKSGLPEGFDSAVGDFEKKNQTKTKLTKSFHMQVPYRLLEEPDKLEFPAQAPAELEFKPEDRRPFYVISAVGFNPSRTRAIAYLRIYCGSECYSAGYYLLQKNSAGWSLLKASPFCEAIA